MRFNGKEISNLDAISLSNCPKLSDEPRIKTVEYTVLGWNVANVGFGNGRHIDSENSLLFGLVNCNDIVVRLIHFLGTEYERDTR